MRRVAQTYLTDANLTVVSLDPSGTTAKKEAPPKAEAPKAETPKAEAAAAKPPQGYEELTVAQIKEAAATWKPAQLEAALAFEQANAARKGAIAVLESALEED